MKVYVCFKRGWETVSPPQKIFKDKKKAEKWISENCDAFRYEADYYEMELE